jgi:protein-tyrosine phosphatase
MAGFRRPDEAEVRRALEWIAATENQPVFVHCRRGRDRTGVVVAAWRMSREAWSLEQAYEEAKRYRLAWWQIRMKDFIREFEVPTTEEKTP